MVFIVLQEPLGGAHADPYWTSQQIKTAIEESMDVSISKFLFPEIVLSAFAKTQSILVGTYENGHSRVVKAQDA